MNLIGFQELSVEETMSVNGGLSLAWSEWGTIFTNMIPSITTIITDFANTLFAAVNVLVETLSSSLVSAIDAFNSSSVPTM